MPLYTCKWLTSDGTENTEVFEAASLDAAAEQLRARRVMVLSISEVVPERPGGGRMAAFGYVGSGDIVVLFRQLAVLIKAGVTVVGALQVLEEQCAKRRLRSILGTVRMDVETGRSFADALRRYPGVFSSVVVGMIEAGEVGGILDVVLERIATMLEKRAAFRSRLFTSLTYPAILFIAGGGALVFLATKVIPNLEPFIRARTGKLEWNTELLFNGSRWLSTHLGHLLVVSLALAGVILIFSRSNVGRLQVDRLRLSLPVIGSIFLYSSMVQFSRNLASLVSSGVPLLLALRTVRGTIGNEAVARVVDEMHDRVIEGHSLSEPLRKSRLFPPMVAGMVAVGEETGGIDHSLELVSDIFEQLLDTRIKRVNVMIEPLMTIVAVVVVGFVGWSLLGGILSTYKLYY